MSNNFLFFLSLLYYSNSLYIYLESNEKKCLNSTREKNTAFDVVYYVSGQDEEKNVATIEDNNGNRLVTIMNKKNDRLHYFLTKDGEYKFCIENFASTKNTVSFEFEYGINQYSAVSIHTIENFVHGVNNLENRIKRLQFNIRNSAFRKKVHFNIAESIRKKINIYAVVKIGFLILFSVFQLMMITSIFNNVKVVKQININSENKPLKKTNANDNEDFL